MPATVLTALYAMKEQSKCQTELQPSRFCLVYVAHVRRFEQVYEVVCATWVSYSSFPSSTLTSRGHPKAPSITSCMTKSDKDGKMRHRCWKPKAPPLFRSQKWLSCEWEFKQFRGRGICLEVLYALSWKFESPLDQYGHEFHNWLIHTEVYVSPVDQNFTRVFHKIENYACTLATRLTWNSKSITDFRYKKNAILPHYPVGIQYLATLKSLL